MAIGAPFLVGTATGPRPTITITPAVNIPAGSAVIIATDSDHDPIFPTTVSDNAGNPSYTKLPEQQSGANPYISMWAAFNVLPLSTSSTITITYAQAGGTGTQVVSAVGIAVPSGLATSNPTDQMEDGYSTNKNQAFSTGQLGLAGELAVVYWAAVNYAGAPLPGSDWNSIAQFQGTSGTHWVNMAWKIVPTASPVVARASVPSGGNGWAGLAATFKPFFAVTATLHNGGTLTPWHVSSVPGTATLHCGGSILGPAELAPVPPPVPPVFPAGYGPLAADFQAWVQQAFGYCTTGTVFRAEQRVTQSLTAAAYTPLAFDTITEDPFSGWSGTATSAQAANSWLVPWTGVYRVTFRWLVNTTTADQWSSAAIGVSGTNPAWEAGGLLGTSAPGRGGDASVLVPLLAGDYVQMLAWSGSAATTDVSAAGRYGSAEITAVQTGLPG